MIVWTITEHAIKVPCCPPCVNMPGSSACVIALRSQQLAVLVDLDCPARWPTTTFGEVDRSQRQLVPLVLLILIHLSPAALVVLP